MHESSGEFFVLFFFQLERIFHLQLASFFSSVFAFLFLSLPFAVTSFSLSYHHQSHPQSSIRKGLPFRRVKNVAKKNGQNKNIKKQKGTKTKSNPSGVKCYPRIRGCLKCSFWFALAAQHACQMQRWIKMQFNRQRASDAQANDVWLKGRNKRNQRTIGLSACANSLCMTLYLRMRSRDMDASLGTSKSLLDDWHVSTLSRSLRSIEGKINSFVTKEFVESTVNVSSINFPLRHQVTIGNGSPGTFVKETLGQVTTFEETRKSWAKNKGKTSLDTHTLSMDKVYLASFHFRLQTFAQENVS